MFPNVACNPLIKLQKKEEKKKDEEEEEKKKKKVEKKEEKKEEEKKEEKKVEKKVEEKKEEKKVAAEMRGLIKILFNFQPFFVSPLFLLLHLLWLTKYSYTSYIQLDTDTGRSVVLQNLLQYASLYL